MIICEHCRSLSTELFQKPRHVLSEVDHCLHAFLIIADFSGLSPDSDIPVARPGNDHLADEEKEIERAEDMGGAGPSHGNYGCSRFPLEHVAVRPGDHAAPLDKGFHVRRHIGEVCWRPEEDSICFDHLFDVFVHLIFFDGASLIFVLETFIARDATLEVLPCQGDELGLDSLPAQLIENRLQEDGRITVSPRASIECNDFHDLPPV